ncbi:tRNA (adenosine(37)-N6)-threonylcarbamoyltransferase complex dimerization subunit type 1 TsaB [Sphingomonas sp. LB-2]|uniref:tRNA (adenosine(37)-N6)-threonylcarbamoyltransferase complex dimerization subunit type 1 TsaB n=1 Tax=Sphingomonas caeni TaxID=2984949 RepID=UPI002230841D|nr:tRNA (adenosine(37)-N6)-threonylcarbamoyltransferase complex dimerization subunit type 1 TsaB [Sphingomonas caeni]MCW3847992.1 tRNA (adenosine(37)-N6)-threonylcarbamoyltransferase complex dimerization subunit type 1 TsaB [Sphingomonas caeni]
MTTLVIETATAACSVALIRGGQLIAQHHEVVGRGHAERLVPMIADLPDQGRATQILVDVGPGSFTGIRVGLAAAIGLGIGWGVPVSGYSSLANIAAATFARETVAGMLAVVLEGGHGEVFMQMFGPPPMMNASALESLAPDAARERLGGHHAVGDGLRWLGFGDPRTAPRGSLPHAADALLLPEALRSLAPRPVYGRAPDAKTLAELGRA